MDLEGRDIVVFGLQPWDIEIGSNCKNIAAEFSKKNRVLYVNKPLDRKSIVSFKDNKLIRKRLEVIKGERPMVTKVSDTLWTLEPDCILESANWIRPHFVFKLINKLNSKRLVRAILKGVEQVGFSNYVLFNDNSIFLGFYLKELLNPEKYIYYIRDNLTQYDYWKYHGSKLEPALIGKADLVVNNSKYYTDYASEYNKASFDIGQGCDFSSFSKNFDEPDDLKSIGHPRIGYVGFLDHKRLNIDLINDLAKLRSDWNIILVGGGDQEFDDSDLHKIENVHFLGKKSPENLPAYINGFDVCINPQLLNEITNGNYPRKIDEYLYFGKPTVATGTVAMENFKEYVYLGEHVEDYVLNIEKGLDEDDPSLSVRRKEFAKSHSWENSVSKIYAALNETY